MFRFSFKNIPKQYTKDKKSEEFPLIAALNFGNLAQKDIEEGTPIFCSNCGSIFTDLTKFTPDNNDYAHFCPYCGTKNKISKETYQKATGLIKEPQSSEMDQADLAFLLEKISSQQDAMLEKMEIRSDASGFPIYIATIDISGSMSGGKLDAVKHALIQNIHKITAKAPNTQFILIPFETNVELFLSPKNPIIFKDGPLFFNKGQMQEKLADSMKNVEIKPLKSSYEEWTANIKQMQHKRMTALGPALFLGVQALINIQLQNKSELGGKLLLLTDGLANVGVGAVESSIKPDGEIAQFYHKISEICVKHNIIVDMVGVRDKTGGNSVALNIIGQVTDYTGGQMLFITADQVETAFGDLRGTNYVARNVILRVYAPDYLQLSEIQGAHTFGDIQAKIHGEAIRIGGFSPDREIYLKFTPNTQKKLLSNNIPIQIQLEYLDEQGNKKLRTVERSVKVVQKSEEFEAQYDAKIATAYELSKASFNRSKGDIKFARTLLSKSKARNVALHKKYNHEIGELNALVADEIDEWDQEDRRMEMEQVHDQQSFYAASGQARFRSSYGAKLKRMKKKQQKDDK